MTGLLAAVMVLALGGCGLTADENVHKEPVRQLECTQPGALPVIVPMEGARAALAWSDYTTEKTTVQVVDVYGDTVRGEVELEGSWELTEQRLAGGRLALRDWESGLWRFLSADLKDEGTWAAADMNGYFSYDGKSYWFLRDHVLRRQEVAGGEAVPVQLSADLRIADITGMDAESGRMTVQVLLSPYSLECGTAVVDTESGEVLLLQREVYQATFSGESACLLSFDMEKLGYSARYGSSGRFWFADASLFMDTGGDLYAVGSPAYLMGVGAEHSTQGHAGRRGIPGRGVQGVCAGAGAADLHPGGGGGGDRLPHGGGRDTGTQLLERAGRNAGGRKHAGGAAVRRYAGGKIRRAHPAVRPGPGGGSAVRQGADPNGHHGRP